MEDKFVSVFISLWYYVKYLQAFNYFNYITNNPLLRFTCSKFLSPPEVCGVVIVNVLRPHEQMEKGFSPTCISGIYARTAPSRTQH